MKPTMQTRKILLMCGILSSLLYFITDMIGGMLWQGYSFIDQPISALAAVGSPVAGITSPLFFVYGLLLLAFGFGVWTASKNNKKSMRIMAALLISIGIVGLMWTPFPMHLDEPVDSPANTMHSVFAGIQVISTLLAIGFGAVAFRNWFRFYSIFTILILLIAGFTAFWLASSGESLLFFGVIERINVYGYLMWMAVLAFVLLRAEKNAK